jgi:hypothetical protein
MGPRLEIAACRSQCSWKETDATLDGERLFACAGCGSEWVASEPWTPIDWTGAVPEAVQAARQAGRRTRGRG